MAKLTSINPCAAAQLDDLRNSMRQASLNRQLAATALQATAQMHHAATARARIGHKRRPKVALA